MCWTLDLHFFLYGIFLLISSVLKSVLKLIYICTLTRYEALFKQTDNDKDGFVSGVEIKNLFLQTGLQQNILAHIW